MNAVFRREVEDEFFDSDFARLMEKKRFKTVFSNALQNYLTEAQRETLVQFYVEKKCISEIASLRGVYPSTVHRTLVRARKNLYRAISTAGCLK